MIDAGSFYNELRHTLVSRILRTILREACGVPVRFSGGVRGGFPSFWKVDFCSFLRDAQNIFFAGLICRLDNVRF